MMNIKNIFIWALRIISAGILLQTLYFKFSAHPQSVYIFSKIGLEPYGRIGVGVMELIASLLILIPRTTGVGGLLGVGLMSGAVFFHLTSLGIAVDGDTDLFWYGVIVLVICVVLVFFNRHSLLLMYQHIRQGKNPFTLL